MSDKKPKPRFVEATAEGYYNGKRVPGTKTGRFWLADGEKEFSKSWMKDADPDKGDPLAPATQADAIVVHDALAQVAVLEEAAGKSAEELLAAREEAETARAEGDKAKTALEKVEGERDKLKDENEKLKADLAEATKPAAKSDDKKASSGDGK